MYVPTLGDAVPKNKGKIFSYIGKLILKLLGWRLEGELPNLPSFVMMGAPHTSNWDGFYAILTLLALGIKTSWMAKNSLFRKPLAGFMKRLGGIPIDRTTSHGLVQQTAQALQRSGGMVLLVTPEGTRKRVAKWKTGFYHVAREAGTPIVPAYIDYPHKRIGFAPAMFLTEDKTADLLILRKYYKSRMGKHPENYNEDVLGE